MANTYLIDIGLNDSTQDIARKCNANFRRLSSDQSKQNKAGLRQVSVYTDSELSSINDHLINLDNTINDFNDVIDDINNNISEIMESMIPDVGTWMFAEFDPNDKYPDTTWEQVADGTFLMASGDIHETGNEYGSNEVTLTIEQLPSHSHKIDIPLSNTYTSTSGATFSISRMASSNTRIPYTESTGGSKPHNNIPQSIAIPLWHRVS